LRLATPTATACVFAAAAFVIAAWALRQEFTTEGTEHTEKKSSKTLRALRVLRGEFLVPLAAVLLLGFSSAWVALAPPRPQLQPGVLELTALDVGQGDALLVITPDGHTLLVDGGGQLGPSRSAFDFGEDVVAPYLWQRGITRLDAIALTHAHQDH